MWYVIQTKTGYEEDLRILLEKISEPGLYRECFLPLYEDVRRHKGIPSIHIRRFIPGYLFVDTDSPADVFQNLRRIPEFTRILGMEEKDGTKIFIPLGAEDQAFLETLMENGLMHVSLVQRAKSGRIERIVGPLAKYANRIVKLDVPHRRAIVETEMFGKKRRIKFGIWLETDAPTAWLSLQMGKAPESTFDIETDIGIHPGDRVIDETGLFGDQIFTVDSVDMTRRIIHTTFELAGTTAKIELFADDVRKV